MRKRSIVIVAHSLRSLWNIGALFRTADAFSIDHIHCTGYTATPPRAEISKTALGAETWIPWSSGIDIHDVLNQRKSEGYEIVALERNRNSKPLCRYQPSAKSCLILGHEILGVPADILARADHILEIPMLGQKESLNVTVAAGIAMYHLRCWDCQGS